MEIVHIASEFAPLAKVGGLGDAVSALAKEQTKLGQTVSVILPKYDTIDLKQITDLVEVEGAREIWTGEYEGVTLFLVESDPLFARGRIYGQPDDGIRFLTFCQKVAKFLEGRKKGTLHLHDWPAAAMCLLNTGWKTVYSIHNFAYQGVLRKEEFPLEVENGLIDDPIEDDAINLMKAALLFADRVTTVSPTYLKEIQTQELGNALDDVVRKMAKKCVGILNGLDTDYWNPETDPHLVENYNIESVHEGKAANKAHVQKQLGLEVCDKPLLVSITRLVPQKGPDLIHYGMEKALEQGAQCILLGSICDLETKDPFEKLAKHPHVACIYEYNESLSHLLYAGSDLFLMPSIYEPCGLAQMIAMRYGSIPLVRKTGGLKDTVFDPERSDEPNGFSFIPPDNKGVASVIERAFAALGSDLWQDLIERGMQTDFSWAQSAAQYQKLYESI